MNAYAALEARFKRIADLDGAAGILGWDQAVMMPPGAVEGRADQLASLRAIAHELLTAPEVAELLEDAAALDLDDWQRANLREMRRKHARAAVVPTELVAALARATSRCEAVWREARAAGDYGSLRPGLEEVFRLSRERANAVGEALGLEPYDALLDQWQPGLRRATIDALFEPLAARLPGLIERALAHQAAAPEPRKPQGPFPQAVQEALAREMMTRFGFDFERGRLDVSTHPFCGGAVDDVRITTRYDDGFVSALMAVLHETGHGLYEQGLPRAFRHQPVGRSRGMAVHESQSLIVEMQACRSRPFLRFLGPRLAEAFGADPAFDEGNLVRLYTRVERGLIRVDADELTYPLHIVQRYRLETEILDGRLDLADLPAAWNAAMHELLGVAPQDDRNGCLQDIHWPVGAIGYFPCYTLGALIAAQMFQAVSEAEPGLDEALARGEPLALVEWLRANVHAHASRLEADDLVERATGAPLSVAPFFAHVERRYLA